MNSAIKDQTILSAKKKRGKKMSITKSDVSKSIDAALDLIKGALGSEKAGHKYRKRMAKPGGGFRYVYVDAKAPTEPVEIQKYVPEPIVERAPERKGPTPEELNRFAEITMDDMPNSMWIARRPDGSGIKKDSGTYSYRHGTREAAEKTRLKAYKAEHAEKRTVAPSFAEAGDYDKKIGIANGTKYPKYAELKVTSQLVATKTALNPKSIYDWAVKHGHDYNSVWLAAPDDVASGVFEDKPLPKK